MPKDIVQYFGTEKNTLKKKRLTIIYCSIYKLVLFNRAGVVGSVLQAEW